jgi:hypothetical protein
VYVQESYQKRLTYSLGARSRNVRASSNSGMFSIAPACHPLSIRATPNAV